MTAPELYEVRNIRSADGNMVFADLGAAIQTFTSKARHDDYWYLSRVSDGAPWRSYEANHGAPYMTLGFGRRVYTATGDSIRLERASKRVRTIAVESESHLEARRRAN